MDRPVRSFDERGRSAVWNEGQADIKQPLIFGIELPRNFTGRPDKTTAQRPDALRVHQYTLYAYLMYKKYLRSEQAVKHRGNCVGDSLRLGEYAKVSVTAKRIFEIPTVNGRLYYFFY